MRGWRRQAEGEGRTDPLGAEARRIALEYGAQVVHVGELTSIHARYAGRPDAPWLSPAIGMLSQAAQRRALILGRAILLAYRFSGGAVAVLASARLRVEPDCVRLEVTSAARAPDSEVVLDRLKLLAAAIGVRRSEIVVRDEV